jgi:dipeptidyl aminopeptidase/acylaminoacyl peptidase
VTSAPLIPRRILFGEPAHAEPSLSPTGTHLAFLGACEDGLGVWCGTLRDRDFRPLADGDGQPITDYVWARDGRHLLYVSDRDGAEQDHLMAVDLVTGDTRDLTPGTGLRAQVTGLQARAPHTVLVELIDRSADRRGLYRVDVRTGAREPVETPAGLSGWLTDPDLRVRAARRSEPDGGLTVMMRPEADGPWRPVLTLPYEEAAGTELLGFTGDGKDLLLLSPWQADRARLLRLSGVTGTLEVLLEEPGAEVVGASLHPVTGQADLAYVRHDRTDLLGLTLESACDVARIRRLTRGDVGVLGRDATNGTWLVMDNASDAAAEYLLFDRATGAMERLFTHQPELAGRTLAEMEPFSFTSRDGLTVHGYLTFPPGARHDLPAVLNVHGGPWDRAVWGFRAEPQWLADRGYLSIEVNYRGSVGYGRSFATAGDHEWGGRMQDDLIDAVRWVVARGHADPDRIAVYGSSYGGYAALAGAAFTPGVFRCAVAVAAPVNLLTFVRSVPGHAGPVGARLRRRIGDPDTESEFLWSRSPLSRVDDIRIPLLLAYGANDPRVPVGEAEQLVAELRARGIPHQYLLFGDEGHGFAKQRNSLAFYTAAEAFLARHLGGRHEPAT